MTDRYRVIQDGNRWRCIRCGSCCKADFEDKWLDYINALHDHIDGTEKCTYLRFEYNKYSCIIYKNRPNACKAFPFTLRKQDDGNYKLVIHARCRGYGHGKIIDIRQKIQQCMRHSNREFHTNIRFDFTCFDINRSVVLVR